MEACLLSSLAHPSPCYIRAAGLGRKRSNAATAGKHLAGPHPLCSTRKLLLLESLLSVRSAGKLLGEPHTSFSIREPTRVRSPMTVGSVGKPLVILPTSPSISGFTLGSNPMNAKNVEGPLGSSHSLFCITEPRRVSNPTFVKTAGRLLFVVPS